MYNEKERKFCNLPNDYKGAGLKIGVFEYNTLKEEYDNVSCPVPYLPVDRDDDEYRKNHGYKTSKIYANEFPEAEIFVLPPTSKGIDWAIENGVNLANFSISTVASGNLDKLSKQSIMIAAAGNNGEKENHKENMIVDQGDFVVIGAVRLINGKPIMEDYSSYGKGKVDAVCFTRLKTWSDMGYFYGSSASAPFFGVQVGYYMKMFKDQLGVYPKNDEIRTYIKRHTLDILEYGKDDRSGCGVPILPDKVEFDVLEFKVDSTTYKINGEEKESDVAPQILDGRLMVPTYCSRELGLDALWDGQTRTVKWVKEK